MTMTKFQEWLRLSRVGDRIEYYRGNLANARKNPEIGRVAKVALTASEMKLVHLVQKRHGKGDYSYMAVRR